MTKLTFYGGVGEIGGNKILLEDKDTKIFLDFGVNYGDRSRYYSEPWLSPRGERGLLEFGLLPKLDGVYRFDEAPAQVDAAFISHAHTDHSMYISFLKREIPVYCGETTSVIIRTFSEVMRTFETNIQGLTMSTFQTGDKIKIGSMEVVPIHVDHSVPGSHGFIIHTSEGAVVYTGDFRIHGTKARMTEDFIEAAAESKPIAMLCEGTNMIGTDSSTEDEVKTKINRVVGGTSHLVLANFRYSDVDRTRTFHEIAKKYDRKLAISIRQAYMLKQLEDKKLDLPRINSPEFLIFRRGKQIFFKWEKEILNLPNIVDSKEVQRIQRQVILASSFSDLKEMLDIRPKSGSCYINSSSEPFNEEQELEYGKFVNWLDHFGLPMYQIHCSGHAMPNEIRRFVEKISPRTIFPIHTEHPQLFSRFLADTVKIESPQRYRSYDLA